MRHYAKIYPQFWIGETGKQMRELGVETYLVAAYLLTSPHANMLGIYYLPIILIAHETGLSTEEASKALQSLCQIHFCSYDKQNEFVWVHNMALYQIGEVLKPNDHQVKSVNRLYQSLPNLSFLNDFYLKYQDCFHLNMRDKKEGPFKTLPSQEQELEQEQEQDYSLSRSRDVVKFENYFCETKSLPHSLLHQPTQSTKRREEAKAVLEFLNQKANRVFRLVDSNLSLIMTRLQSGATVTQCRQVIAKKAREWGSDGKMQLFLRPKTLFNATNFEQYLGELVIPKEEGIA